MKKSDLRIINLMIEKIDRLIEVVSNHSLEEIESNYLYSDTIQYEFEKLYEDSTKLSPEFFFKCNNFPISELRSIRNRVAHDYSSVVIQILFDTVKVDIPLLREALVEIISSTI